MLEAPYPLPGVKSPQNPLLGSGTPNLPASRGFEGMAITPDGKTLYPMLEGALTTDPDQRRLIINQFDLRKRRYTGRQWFYHLEATGQAIGDFTALTETRFLVIERDNFQGAAAAFKKIYIVNLDEVDDEGFLVKHEVADLLQIDDPHDIGGQGPIFRFPFQTIESVIPLSNTTLGVLDDNNYPFSNGRVAGQSDPNEFIVIRLDRPLRGASQTPSPRSRLVGRRARPERSGLTRASAGVLPFLFLRNAFEEATMTHSKTCRRRSTAAGFSSTRGTVSAPACRWLSSPGSELVRVARVQRQSLYARRRLRRPDAGRHRAVDAAGAGAGRSR